MNFLKLTLLVLGVVSAGTACRESKVYGPAPTPAAGTGAGAAGTAGGSAGAGAGTGAGAGGSASTAIATLAGFMGGTVTGTATFAKGASTDVSVTIALSNCMAGKAYPVHIHAGTSCADVASQGDHWGPARGEGIPDVTCTTTTGTGMHTRTAANPTTSWTIGGDALTNVVGHAFVVHSADMPMTRVACGVIR